MEAAKQMPDWLYKMLSSLAIATLLILLIFSLGFGVGIEADVGKDNGMPVRPGLPARPKPTASKSKSAHIELQIAPAADVWTEIEWQDGAGEWHLVEGWRGFSSKAGLVRWFVAENDFSKGPFRWQVYLFEDGDFLASSESFFLPGEDGATTKIKVDAPDIALFFF